MANDFSSDANCVALYRFESGALTVDSKGTNTLTAVQSPTEELVDFKEGVGCVALDDSNPADLFSITDANLNSGFPCKSGETNKAFSVCCWFKCHDLTASYTDTICGKQGGGAASFWINVQALGDVHLAVFGAGWQEYVHATKIAANIWYHLGVTYDDSDKSYRIRIWDDNAGAILGVDKTGTGTKNMVITADPFMIGSAMTWAAHSFDGLIDEVVVFNDILTTDQIDAIRSGTYGSGGGGGANLLEGLISESPLLQGLLA